MDYKLPKIDQDKVFLLKKAAKREVETNQEFQQFIKINNISEEIVDSSLSRFIKVLEDRKKCEICPGIEKCKKDMGHYQLDLVYDDIYERIENSVVPCKYEKVRLNLKKDFIVADINETYLDYDLKDTLKVFGKERLPLCKYLFSFMDQLDENMSPKGVFLNGDSEVGKTFIMTVFAKTLVEKKYGKIAFINTISYFDRLNNVLYNEKETFSKMMDEIKNVDYLFLDDFGNEYKSAYLFDNMIFPLFSYRLQRNLPIFVTTLYSIDEIRSMYTFSKASEVKVKRLFEQIENSMEKYSLRGMKYPR